MPKLYSFLKLTLALTLCLNSFISYSQVDLGLSFSEFFSWEPDSLYATNISNTPLAKREKGVNMQAWPNLDTNTRILYSPDGMNNFAPYVDSSNRFNLFNFSHWQYIDMLAWFGGTSGMPVMIPAKPWVDAAHKNGVKVIGCVFLAPQAWGGSETKVLDFLVKDSLTGEFLAVDLLRQMTDYFKFDGWLLNFETSVSSSTGGMAQNFVQKLDSAITGDIIWYDAMLPSGTVSWQNELNSANSFFFENTQGMFTNYWWVSNDPPSSAAHAQSLGRSPFDVYMGADMWPDRTHQPAFNDFTWIEDIVENNVAHTSIALFATNFTYNHSYSNFNNDASRVQDFYSTERKIFSGIDQDPFAADQQWKGIAHYLPVRTTLRDFPLETDFNTGHGLNYYSQGNIVRSGDWHNLGHQSILPSWTFSQASLDTIQYRFDDAYNGGSHVYMSASNIGIHNIPLFSTAIKSDFSHANFKLVLKSSNASAIDSVTVEFTGSNSQTIISKYILNASGSWETYTSESLDIASLDTLIGISLNVYNNSAFELKLGMIELNADEDFSINENLVSNKFLKIYPVPSNGFTTFELDPKFKNGGGLKFYNLEGKMVLNTLISPGINEIKLKKGVYLFEFMGNKQFKSGKLIVH